MEFETKKEGSEKYLLLKESDFNENDYRIQMIMNNNIQGLLPIKIRNINNEKELLYDITGMVSLSNIFDRSLMKKEELTKFVLAIKQLQDSLKKYLLCEDNIKFDLDYIYYKSKQNHFFFCYCPVEVEDFSLQMKSLFNQVLDYINYNDRDTVSLAYGLQEIASRDEFAIDELLDFTMSTKEEFRPLENVDQDELEFEEKEEEEEKQSFIEKIKKILRKNKKEEEIYDEEYDNEYNTYIEEKESITDINFETDNLSDEEATVLLSGNVSNFIVLKSVNHEPPIMIVPDKFPYVIGKSKRSCDISINSKVISRVHARINCEEGEYSIEDLNSTNGSFVNEKRLKPHEITSVEKGDIIKLADIEFSVE